MYTYTYIYIYIASQVFPIKTMDSLTDWQGKDPTLVKSNFKAKVYQDKNTANTHYWYVVLMDCSLEQIYHEAPDIHYELHFTQPSGSYLPADEFGLTTISFLLVFSYIIFITMLFLGIGLVNVFKINLNIRKLGV